MRSSLVVFATVLGLTDAAMNILSPGAALSKRQGEAFDPDEDSVQGENCVDAFGEGALLCRPSSATLNGLCITPGQTCCNNLWSCPTGSFCLVDGLCCPDGLDPETCAAENNVSLPPDFGTTPTSTSVPEDTATAEPTDTSAPEDTATAEPTTSEAPSTTAAPTDDDTTTPSATTSPPVVTAGAHHERVGVAAAVMGLAAAIVL